jgi:hypothetical protein
MSGWSGFLLFVVMLVIAWGGVLISMRGLRTGRRVRNAVGLIIFLFVAGILTFRFIGEVRFLREVRSLTPDRVTAVQIGDSQVERNSLRNIASALQHSEWFQVQGGGWLQEVSMTVRTDDGNVHTFRIAQYREGGAVILAVPYGHGEAFSKDLKKTFEDAGLSLPASRR